MGDNRRKIIKEIYIYRESHLPTDGWIQKCFHCDTLTSKNILFKTITQYKGCYVKYWEFNIHLCFSCKRYLYSNKGENIKKFLKFSQKCNDYIVKEYPFLRNEANNDSHNDSQNDSYNDSYNDSHNESNTYSYDESDITL
jgi:hypothetical protein